MLPAYREHHPPVGLEPVVACVWEHEPAEDRSQRVVPDGCVDLIWLAECELVIAGPDTGPRSVDLPAQVLSSGIRLRPGAAGAVLGLPASELRDRQVGVEGVWGEQGARLQESIIGAPPARRLQLLADAVARRGAESDALVIAAAQRLAVPEARVAGVAAELGVGERLLHRRMLAAVGYGPKVLARVARLRRLMALADDSLSSRALEAGYASQAHMNDEVRRLTGTTPVRFLKDAALTAA
jgi:AraC-like DNA-binding protein